MYIRELDIKDAPYMLEWMHDKSVVEKLRADFQRKTIDDCISFIVASQDKSNNVHMAIVDDEGTYMGTVSLKNISCDTAEFGITIRSCAMGKGFSRFGMVSILNYGFQEYGLESIYWCVDPENKRAVRFYEKNGYKQCFPPRQAMNYSEEEKQHYIWYCVHASDVR